MFISLLRKRVEFIYWIPFLNLGIDMSLTYYSGFAIPAFVRAIIYMIFFIYSFKYIKLNGITVRFYIFFFILFIIFLFSQEKAYSFKNIIQVVFSMLMFVVSFYYINTEERLKKFIDTFFWILLISVIATGVGYAFGVGRVFDYQSKYDEEEQIIGLLGSAGLYLPGVILAIMPIIFKFKISNFQKILYPFISFILFIFCLLTVRRTVILIPVLGLLVYLFYERNSQKIIKYFVLSFSIIVLTFPLYQDILIKRFEFRSSKGRFDKDFYKTENRYIENLYLYEQLSEFEDPVRILTGIGNNIFAENITDGEISGRMFHTDIAKLFYGVGIIGMLIYISIYFKIFYLIKRVPVDSLTRDFKYALYGLFYVSVFVSINGSISLVSFRSMNFMLIGSLLGYLYNKASLQ